MSDNNLQYKLDLQRKEFSRAMDSAIKQVEELDKRIDDVNKKGIGGSDGFLKKAAIGGAFAYVTKKVVDFEGAVIDSLKNAQYFSAALRTLLKGDAYQAKALEQELIALAKTTPFSLVDVQEGTKQLLAYGFAAGDITKNMKMLGDISSGVGAPLNDIVYLYGTLRTQGRAFTKDIYQFTGRGIPIVRELAKQFKVTDDKIMELAKDGKIGFAEIEKAFRSMTSEGGQFFGMMDEQSKTVGGMLSNYEDSWEQLRVNIGQSQTGIIANTVKWASRMVEVMNEYFVSDNFRDKATGNVPEGYKIRQTSMWNPLTWDWFGLNNQDKSADERYRVADRKGNQREFKTQWEADFFRNQTVEGQGYRDIGSAGTEARFIEFSDKYLDRLNKISEQSGDKTMAAIQFNKQMMAERENIIAELKKGTISSELAVNEFAVIKELMLKANGLQRLQASKEETKKTKPDLKKEDSIGTGLEEGFARPQNLYITINKLTGIEQLTLNKSVEETAPQIKEIIARTMLEAVNDANNMMK